MGGEIKANPLTSDEKLALAGQINEQGRTKFQMLYVPANTVQGQILVLAYDGDEESNPKAVAAATSTFKVRTVVATEDQGATAGFQWCVIAGECEALVNGTTDVAKDEFLEVINAATAFTGEGTSRLATSGAIAREAQTNPTALTDIYLLGEGHTIAAT